METSYKKLLALFMVCIIASCGFHLRGMTNVSFKKISLEGQKISLMEDLRKILIDNKVEIVTNKENPELTIEFISENSEKRIIAPSRWFGTGYTVNHDTSDLYCENWELIDV
jgi:outer membrane lipopolysaccharide assembly protein LptE/RlpB